MPQTKPMMWIYLFILMNSALLILSSKLYHKMNMKKNNTMKTKNSYKTMKW